MRGEPRGRRRSVIAVKGSRLYLLARTAGPLKPGGIEAGPGGHVVVDVDGAADAAGGSAESVFGRTPTATSTRSTSLVGPCRRSSLQRTVGCRAGGARVMAVTVVPMRSSTPRRSSLVGRR